MDEVDFECGVVNFECNVVNFECNVASFECNVASFECNVASFECSVLNFECDVANFEWGVANFASCVARFAPAVARNAAPAPPPESIRRLPDELRVASALQMSRPEALRQRAALRYFNSSLSVDRTSTESLSRLSLSVPIDFRKR